LYSFALGSANVIDCIKHPGGWAGISFFGWRKNCFGQCRPGDSASSRKEPLYKGFREYW